MGVATVGGSSSADRPKRTTGSRCLPGRWSRAASGRGRAELTDSTVTAVHGRTPPPSSRQHLFDPDPSVPRAVDRGHARRCAARTTSPPERSPSCGEVADQLVDATLVLLGYEAGCPLQGGDAVHRSPAHFGGRAEVVGRSVEQAEAHRETWSAAARRHRRPINCGSSDCGGTEVGSAPRREREHEIDVDGGSSSADAERGVCWLLDAAARVVPGQAPALVDAVRHVLGAQAGRVFVADYSLRRLQQVDVAGPVGAPHPMAGTIAGRAFTSGEVIVSAGPADRGVDPARRRHRPDRAARAGLRRVGRRLCPWGGSASWRSSCSC